MARLVSRFDLYPRSMVAEIALREIVRYAASRAMFCPGCESVMDVSRTLLLEKGERTIVRCTRCETLPAGWTVTHDGRELFPSSDEQRATRKNEQRLNHFGLFRRTA